MGLFGKKKTTPPEEMQPEIQEIREQVKHPAQIAFEKNLKFLNKESYPIVFFQMIFTKSDKIAL